MTDIVNILHISDLHFGVEPSDKKSPTAIAQRENTLSSLIKELKKIKKEWLPDIVAITGDIGWKGNEKDYTQAQAWLEKELLSTLNLKPDHLVVCAGNHDLDRKKTIGMSPPLSREDADEWLKMENLDNFIRPFAAFNTFCENVKIPKLKIHNREFHLIGQRELNGLRLVVLNSAWFCRGDKDKGKLWTGLPQLETMASKSQLIDRDHYDDAPITIAMLHHPPEWLHDHETNSYEPRPSTFGYLAERSHIILSGHVHAAPEEPDRKHNAAWLFKGGATYSGGNYRNNFSIFQIDKQNRTITRAEFEFDPRRSKWNKTVNDPISLRKKEDSPKKKKKTTSPRKKAPSATKKTLEADIRNYREKAESFHASLPAAGFATTIKVAVNIEDLHVPLHAMVDLCGVDDENYYDACHAEKHMATRENLEISLFEAFQQSEKRNFKGIVILGDPGSGKTTHLKCVLLWCLRKGPASLNLPRDMLPVYLPLRELEDPDKGLDAFIQKQLSSPHLDTPKNFGKQLLKRGNLLFLLDGLDEVSNLEKREQVAEWITQALNCHPTCRFIVTCRFAGYSPTVRLNAGFLEMHIRPFTTDQAETFIRNWYTIIEKGLAKDPDQAEIIASDNAESLIQDLKRPNFRSSRIFELTRNPLLLTNICLVHRFRAKLPDKRARLYKECIDVLLEHWRDAKKINIGVNAEDGRRILQPAALWLHKEEGRTRATAEELAPHIEPALTAVDWPDGTAEDFLRKIRDESGLLTGWDQEHYGFMHLGFQEYLAAREIRSRAFKDPSVLKELASHFGESWWQEVSLLLLALEDPSLFEPYMQEVLKQNTFTKHTALVEACLTDTAEKSVIPFIELLEQKPGSNKALWARQLYALKIAERLDPGAVDRIKAKLMKHPFADIRNRLAGKAQEANQDILPAKRGGYELVKIPEGMFVMGSPESEKGRFDREGPQHNVHVPEFYMGRYPVTNQEYGLFLKENPKRSEPKYWGDRRFNQPMQPVVGVSWDDARAYAEWAGLRMPSEAEWEYACRAGTTGRYYTGDTEQDLDRAGWYEKNSGNQTHSVGEKEPNEFGLYDMHGNVWEWVEDDIHDQYKGAPTDGRAWTDTPRGSYRVLRGGGWGYAAVNCRSALRDGGVPIGRGSVIGFRLACSQVSSKSSK